MHHSGMDRARQVVTLSRISRGRYVATDNGTPLELRLSRWRYRGEAQIGAQTYQLQRTGILDRRVAVLGADGQEMLCLSRKQPKIPGLPDCEFRVRGRWRGYEAQLRSPGAAELVVRTGHGGRSDVTAEISGTLPG